MKLAIHELKAAIAFVREDRLHACFKILARVKLIQKQLFEQWAVLETLTPSEYEAFRPTLGSSSGFQSAQYRALEFLLGNKQTALVDVFRYDAATHAELTAILEAPSLYDEYLRHLARRGLPVPASCIERDWWEPHVRNPALVPVFKTIYDDPERWWDAYEMAEKLVDVEESFQLWRFRHLKTVERTIGHKTGNGRFLRRGVPAEGARPHVLSGADRRPHGDRHARTVTAYAGRRSIARRSRRSDAGRSRRTPCGRTSHRSSRARCRRSAAASTLPIIRSAGRSMPRWTMCARASSCGPRGSATRGTRGLRDRRMACAARGADGRAASRLCRAEDECGAGPSRGAERARRHPARRCDARRVRFARRDPARICASRADRARTRRAARRRRVRGRRLACHDGEVAPTSSSCRR